MKQLVAYFGDSHPVAPDQLAKILASDWPPLKVKVIQEDLSEVEYEVAHTRGCSDCMAELAGYMLDS